MYHTNLLEECHSFVWIVSISFRIQQAKIFGNRKRVQIALGVMWVVYYAFCTGEISCFYSNVCRHWQKKANILVFWVRVVFISNKLSPLQYYFPPNHMHCTIGRGGVRKKFIKVHIFRYEIYVSNYLLVWKKTRAVSGNVRNNVF